eukprot:CAMPEP_0168729228 /NCGR_PEP_ID=MMETSP0724-20121128/6091_1 /TAXON_ID=265536 /ORGANISM="Amphiprora sp., Strain CCMP467" /LENGTH=202 /DNA_ID=CAMNT_0008776097 /DNA_START=18 /DNA_END=622 /DNA_ORIENTATION=+
MAIFSSSSLSLIALATVVVTANAQIIEIGKSTFGGGSIGGGRHRRQNTAGSSRHLGGKKGGKKGGSKQCEPVYYDGVRGPLVCDFPVVVPNGDCGPSESGQSGTIVTDDGELSWSYGRGIGFTAINMDTEKAYVSPEASSSDMQEVSFAQPEIFNVTVIGAVGLSLSIPGTGLPSNFFFLDGYLELIANATSLTYQTTAFDG